MHSTFRDVQFDRIEADAQQSRAGRAFTLIELLVVVAIITLLISILLPSLQRSREHATRALCLSNMHHLSHSFGLYAHDHGGFLPPMMIGGPVDSYGRYANKGGMGLMLEWMVYPDGVGGWGPSEYVHSLDLLFCPGDFLYSPERFHGTGLGPSLPGDGNLRYTGYQYLYVTKESHNDPSSDRYYGLGRYSTECDQSHIIVTELPSHNPSSWLAPDGPFWHLEDRCYLRLGGSAFSLSQSEVEARVDNLGAFWTKCFDLIK